MKTLIAYYSRTGNTKKVCEFLSKKLNADIDEIIDKKKRKGAIGFVVGGKDAMQKNMTEIKTKKDPSQYDFVILGTPVWADNVTPAIRTYAYEYKHNIKNTAFICTTGMSGIEKTFMELEKILEKKPKATFSMLTKDVKNEKNIKTKSKDFIKSVKD